jgi:hypothetical protein
MSGSGGSRGDSPSSGGGGGGGGGQPADPCLKIRRGPINSPKPAVIAGLKVGSVLSVRVRTVGTSLVLLVEDSNGAVAGSLTFVGYLEIVDCIQKRSISYQAVVINIAGGVCEVRVEPV